MKVLYFILLLCGFATSTDLRSQPNWLPNEPGSKILFDDAWLFYKGGIDRFLASQINYNDSNWTHLDLPHDWSIEDLSETHTPFKKNAVSQRGGGFTVGGEGWYRKAFELPKELKGKMISVLFEGIYMNADIWINGIHLGNNPYGYTEFYRDITGFVRLGERNVLAVQVKNEGLNSRWYSGSGIYRHVWLNILDSTHITYHGVTIKTPVANKDMGIINIRTMVENEKIQQTILNLSVHIADPEGKKIKEISIPIEMGHKENKEIESEVILNSPELWSVDSPSLYTAIVELHSNADLLLDRRQIKFGIREIKFDARKGFQLNGIALKLKGGNVHHDNGPLGSKAYDRAEIRKVKLLKINGFNAVRCAHNPPSVAFLNACDSLGILVIDELFDMWDKAKSPYDYHLYFEKWWKKDTKSIVFRDRNHPSIIMWSIGNEVPYNDSNRGHVDSLVKVLTHYVKTIDTTRPVTASRDNISSKTNNFFAPLDVSGYNYGVEHYVKDHQRSPNRIMYASESFPPKSFDYWMAVRDNSWVIGDFVWTGIDYLGEAAIGWSNIPNGNNFYPWSLAYTGDIDICGWKRPQSFYRDVLWNDGQLSLFVKPPVPSFPVKENSFSYWHWEDVVADWNWTGLENQAFEVKAYSSCDEVELFLNKRSFGKKRTCRSGKYMVSWKVPYQPGNLKAVGYLRGKIVAVSELNTVGVANTIKLTADRENISANNQDLSYINVELLDSNGFRNPKADNLVSFKINGPGKIIGVGNANPISTESFTSLKRKVWQGRCLLIVKSSWSKGEIMVTASTVGLPDSIIKINAL